MTRLVIVIFVLLFLSYPTYGGTVIPIEIEYGNVFANASINGLDVRLGIDLGGAAYLRLNNDIVASLEIESESSTEVRTNAYGISKETRGLILPTLEIGGTVFRNVRAFTVPDTTPVQGDPPDWWPKSDGMIGREFLKQFVVVIDYSSSTITLYDHDEPSIARCDGAAIPLIDHPEGIIVTKSELDHGTLTAIWDTGASYSFIKAQVVEEKKIPVVEDQDRTSFYRSKRFDLDGQSFGPIEFVALPLVEPKDVDVAIGYNFFAGHTVCVNSRERWLRIHANE